MEDRIKEIMQSKAQKFNIPCEHTVTKVETVRIPINPALMARINQNRQELVNSKIAIEKSGVYRESGYPVLSRKLDK